MTHIRKEFALQAVQFKQLSIRGLQLLTSPALRHTRPKFSAL